MAFPLLGFLFSIGSIVYQRVRQKQLQDKLNEEMDKYKGTKVSFDGEVFYLPVCYGNNAEAGGRTAVLTSKNYTYADHPGILLSPREPLSGFNYSTTPGSEFYIERIFTRILTPREHGTDVWVTTKDTVALYWNGENIRTSNLSDFLSGTSSTWSDLESRISLDDYSYFIGPQQSYTGNSNNYIAKYRVARQKIANHQQQFWFKGLKKDEESSTRVYLTQQTAYTYSPVTKFGLLDIDDKPAMGDKSLGYGFRVHLVNSTADLLATSNGLPPTNAFPNTFFSTGVFKYNRDDPQYSGPPTVRTYFTRYPQWTFSGSNLVNTPHPTQNPAMAIADYLLSPVYGLGLSSSELDWPSFKRAAEICDTIVATDFPVGGKVNRASDENSFYNFTISQKKNGEGDVPVFDSNWNFTLGSAASGQSNGPIGSEYKIISFNSSTQTNGTGAKMNLSSRDINNYQGQKLRAAIRLRSTSGPATFTTRYNRSGPKYTFNIDNSFREHSFVFSVPSDSTADSHLIEFWAEPNKSIEVQCVKTDTAFRDIRLYEANVRLDTDKSIRSNIIELLECMNFAELVWSGGKYKLQLIDPTGEGSNPAAFVVTDDDIIQESEISMIWPNANEKFNQAIVTYRNEAEDFANDIVIWPPSNQTVHNNYLNEDKGIHSKTSFFASGITTRIHALAKAEQVVRSSRRGAVIKLKLRPRAFVLEPGDLIRITSDRFNLSNELFLVETVEPDINMTVEVQAVQFNFLDLAFNVPDDVSYLYTPSINNSVFAPINVLFSEVEGIYGYSSGVLTWDPPELVNSYEYIVEVIEDIGETWTVLGTTKATNFTITGLNLGLYSFRVKAVSNLGRSSSYTVAQNLAGEVVFEIVKNTPERVAVIYADDELGTGQTYTYTDQDWIAYYVYSGEIPTLPITTGITFSKFRSKAYAIVFRTTSGSLQLRNNTGSVTIVADIYQGGEEVTNYGSWSIAWFNGTTDISTSPPAGITFQNVAGCINRRIIVDASYVPDNGGITLNATASS